MRTRILESAALSLLMAVLFSCYYDTPPSPERYTATFSNQAKLAIVPVTDLSIKPWYGYTLSPGKNIVIKAEFIDRHFFRSEYFSEELVIELTSSIKEGQTYRAADVVVAAFFMNGSMHPCVQSLKIDGSLRILKRTASSLKIHVDISIIQPTYILKGLPSTIRRIGILTASEKPLK